VLKARKHQTLQELKLVCNNNLMFVVISYNKLDAVKMTALRCNLRDNGAKLRVVKNTFAALSSRGTNLEHVSDLFKTGQSIALAYSNESDPVAMAKAVYQFQKDNVEYLKVLGGVINGKVLNTSGIEQIVKMPSIDQLYAQLVGVLHSPMQSLIRALNSPMSHLVKVLDVYSKHIK